jgi:hypothetical protein
MQHGGSAVYFNTCTPSTPADSVGLASGYLMASTAGVGLEGSTTTLCLSYYCAASTWRLGTNLASHCVFGIGA